MASLFSLRRVRVPLLLLGAAGCGTTPDRAPSASGGRLQGAQPVQAVPLGGAPDGPSWGDGPAALSAAVTASKSAICPGECVELALQASGGRPPYELAWSSLAGGTDRLRVCPTATTTYTAEVSDSYEPEFGEPSTASASLTVEVRKDCQPAEVQRACSVRIPVFDPEFFVPWLFGEADADAAGNLYLAGNLRGTAHFAPDVVFTSDSQYEGAERAFLAKYDAHCNFEWVRWVGGNERPIVFIGMDVARDGTVALTTNMYADAAGTSSAEMTLHSFGPDGEPGFSVNSPEGNSLWVTNLGHTVHYGADGTLAVSGLRSLCLELDPAADGLCVARLDGQGNPLFARALGGASGAGVMLGAEGDLYAAGLTDRQGISLGDRSLSEPGPLAYVVKFTPDGETSWLSVTADIASDFGLNGTQGFVHVDRDGNLLAAWHEVGWGEMTRGLVNTFRLDASGAPLSQHEIAAATGEGASEMVFSALRNGTLVSAVRLTASTGGVPSTTTLTYWDHAGRETRRTQRHHEQVGSVLRLGVSPVDQLVLTSLEGGGVENNQQTALLVEKF